MTARKQLNPAPTGEDWREVEGFGGLYRVSARGEVWSAKNRRHPDGLLKAAVVSGHHSPYPFVHLSSEGKKQVVAVHLLVARAFLGPTPVGMEVRHINGNREDSRLENLAYGTSGQNKRDAVAHGTHVQARKTHCPRGHEYDVVYSYGTKTQRACRTCRRHRQR